MHPSLCDTTPLRQSQQTHRRYLKLGFAISSRVVTFCFWAQRINFWSGSLCAGRSGSSRGKVTSAVPATPPPQLKRQQSSNRASHLTKTPATRQAYPPVGWFWVLASLGLELTTPPYLHPRPQAPPRPLPRHTPAAAHPCTPHPSPVARPLGCCRRRPVSCCRRSDGWRSGRADTRPRRGSIPRRSEPCACTWRGRPWGCARCSV